MAEYQMQESNLPNEEGKTTFYPRMKLWNQVDLEYLANNINYASTFTPGDIMGLVRSLTQEIARHGTRKFRQGRRPGHLHPFAGLAPRKRTRNRRGREPETELDEHLHRQHQFPCRQAIHRRNRKALHTEPLEAETFALLAKVHPGTAAETGAEVPGRESLHAGGRLLPADGPAARQRRQRAETMGHTTGSRYRNPRKGSTQGVRQKERNRHPLRFRLLSVSLHTDS